LYGFTSGGRSSADAGAGPAGTGRSAAREWRRACSPRHEPCSPRSAIGLSPPSPTRSWSQNVPYHERYDSARPANGAGAGRRRRGGSARGGCDPGTPPVDKWFVHGHRVAGGAPLPGAGPRPVAR